jgi:hypothetical protein
MRHPACAAKRLVFFVLSRARINGNRSEPRGTAAFGRPAEFQFIGAHWARQKDGGFSY